MLRPAPISQLLNGYPSALRGDNVGAWNRGVLRFANEDPGLQWLTGNTIVNPNDPNFRSVINRLTDAIVRLESSVTINRGADGRPTTMDFAFGPYVGKVIRRDDSNLSYAARRLFGLPATPGPVDRSDLLRQFLEATGNRGAANLGEAELYNWILRQYRTLGADQRPHAHAAHQ